VNGAVDQGAGRQTAPAFSARPVQRSRRMLVLLAARHFPEYYEHY
jgi:hypothetical protein